jgi:hypothetical protein
MTATVDGQPWKSDTIGGALNIVVVGPNALYILGGTNAGSAANYTSLGMTFGPIDSVGTYPLGVDGISIFGGGGTVSNNSGGIWATPLSGAAGTITITSITATRMAGTFSYTAAALQGGATGTRVVTNGDFDAPIAGSSGTLPLAPDSLGGYFSASLNGTAWNAGISSSSRNGNLGLLTFGAINTTSFLQIVLPLPAGPGSYALDNQPGHELLVMAGSGAGAVCCWGVVGDTGTMVLSTLTATRAAGTFTATLTPQPATAASGTLTITNGRFNVGLFHTP